MGDVGSSYANDALKRELHVSFSGDREELTMKHNLGRMLFGVILGVIGIVLAGGGLYLAALGGSFYYAIVGVLLLAASVLYIVNKPVGFYIYLGAFIFTSAWALWEVGLSPWDLTPRLAGPFVLMVIALLLAPGLLGSKGAATRKWGLAALVIFSVVISGGVYATQGNGIQAPLPPQQDAAIFENPVYAPKQGDWSAYGAGQSAQRYSNLDQITSGNVKNLKRAWVYNTGEIPKKFGSQLTPLKIDHRVYGCTGMNKLFALDANSGKELWKYDPGVSDEWLPYTAACRSVAYYKVPASNPKDICAERIIEGTLDMRLIAVDAGTGQPCPGFGTNGSADLRVGMGQKDSDTAEPKPLIPGTAAITSPPVIVQGVIVTGQQVLDGQRRWAPSGVIRGYDAVTGELRFAWDVNQSEVTKDPPANGYYSFGTPNSWAAPVGDEKLGLAYIPMGNSAGDYYTSLRSDEEKKVNSAIVALDVNTGKPRWVYQMVHADVWDYDLGSQPSLVEFPTPKGKVSGLLVPTKHGDIFVLDRSTGEPLHGVEERPVPQGGPEAAQRSPTQPFSLYHTLAAVDLTEKDMWGLSPIDQMFCRIAFKEASYKGKFTPPELNRPNIQWPGYNGGSDWGSVAVDPRRGVIVANYNLTSNLNMLITREQADKSGLFPVGDPRFNSTGGGAEGNGPQTGAPYAIKVNAGWQMPTGVLCTRPPYGGIRAIELATGKTLWDRPFGTARRNGPFGIPSFLPFEIGTPNNGGAVVTASGLIFIASATDDLIRAIDLRTGETIWSDTLPGGGQANPMIYEQNGKEYLLIMAGGHHFMMTPPSDALIAYALP